MFKIYFHSKCFYLIKTGADVHLNDGDMYTNYDSTPTLKALVDIILQNKEVQNIYIASVELKKLYSDFCSLFEVVEAAGGVVKNTENKLLFIFRNGKWDLPKGKIEKNEAVKTAAIREVEEECGITELELQSELFTSHHIYFMGKTRAIKKTYWYTMLYKGAKKGKPQLEEGISEVKWINKNELPGVLSNTFLSIKEVVEIYLNTYANK